MDVLYQLKKKINNVKTNIYPFARIDGIVDEEGELINVVVNKNTSIPSTGMLPNTFYSLGTISTNTAFTLANAQHNDKYEEYMWEFTVSGTPQITFPSTITWDEEPELENGKTYQVSVVNNLGIIKSW